MDIQTDRLLLAKYQEKNKADFIAISTDESVMRRVDHGALSSTRAEELWLKIIDENFSIERKIWAVYNKKDGEYVGHAIASRRPEIPEDWEMSCILKEDQWGKGFATEIAKALANFGFEYLNLLEIFATVYDDHLVSIKVLEKAGMKFLRHEFNDLGRFSVYSIRKG